MSSSYISLIEINTRTNKQTYISIIISEENIGQRTSQQATYAKGIYCI
jgi:hypothetical protein